MQRIAIIGTGWFGCHIACALMREGYSVRLFERTDRIFSGASGNNQNRLHLGYHYPRSAQTRKEIRLTHDRFASVYPTKEVQSNLFAVASDSWIDLKSYLSIMRGENLPIDQYPASQLGIYNVENDTVLMTKERVIDTVAASNIFAEKLSGLIAFNSVVEPFNSNLEVVVEECVFDACIDCTSGELSFNKQIFFEPAVMAEYEGPKEHFALTVMDGYYPCLYPTATPGRWRVSHVMHTARGVFDKASEARKALSQLDTIEVTRQMTEAMNYFYPSFSKKFTPAFNLAKAVRTKLKNNNASREFCYAIDNRIMRIFSGKICSVFLAEEAVDKWLKTL